MRPRWQRNCWRFCDPSAPSRPDIPGTEQSKTGTAFFPARVGRRGHFSFGGIHCSPALLRRLLPSGFLAAFSVARCFCDALCPRHFAALSVVRCFCDALCPPGIFGGFCRFRRPSALFFAALRRLSCVTAGRRSAPSFLFLWTVICKDRRPRCMPGRTGRPRKIRRGRFSHLDLFRRICYNQSQQELLCRRRLARHCQKERHRCHTPQNVNHSLHICRLSADGRCP